MSIDVREKRLIERAKAGDEKSFESLILSCRSKAYNIALRYLKNEEDALDVLQESFIKIFRHLKNFKEDSRFDTWVYRIIVNTCHDFLRKNSSQKQTDSLFQANFEKETVIEIPDSSGSPEQVYEKKRKIGVHISLPGQAQHRSKRNYSSSGCARLFL